jgi:hypothetical protein
MPCSAPIPLHPGTQTGGRISIPLIEPGFKRDGNGLDKMHDRLKDPRSLSSAPHVECGPMAACFPTVFGAAFLSKVVQGKGEQNVLNENS